MVGLRLNRMVEAKAKAATLLESLVAMVIVLISFGIALMIYVNVANSNNSQQRLSANLALGEVLSVTVQDEAYVDEEIKNGTVTVVKSVQPYNQSKTLMEIHLEAKDAKGKVIAVLDKIVAIDG